MDIQKLRKLLAKRGNKKKLFLFLLIFGVVLFLFGTYGYFYSRAILSFSKVPEVTQVVYRKPSPQRIIISDLKINLDVTESRIVSGVWEISNKGASHLNISDNPGENGNIIIYGHNKKVIFGSLPYIRNGSIIKIITEDGLEHDYKVMSKKTVSPNDLSLIMPTNDETLTLYTCTGFLDSKRFVIVAKPIN